MEADAPTRGPSRWFWLPALVTAVLVAPFVSVATIVLLESEPYVAAIVAALASAALAWTVARLYRAHLDWAGVFALLAAGVSVWVVRSAYAGIS